MLTVSDKSIGCNYFQVYAIQKMISRVKALSIIFVIMGACKFATQTLSEKHLMRTPNSPSTFFRFVGIALTVLFFHSSANAQVDPPGRVARVSYASGNLSLAVAGSDQWIDVPMNRPISGGDSLWVPERGRAELHIGSSAIRLNEKSSLTFLTLSDDSVQLKLTRGMMVVRLRNLTGKEVFEINTPNLAFSLQEAGEYKVIVNDDNTSNVMVRRGAAIAYGDRDSISIREAEQVLFTGTNLNHNSINRMPPYDTFDQWVNDRDRAEDTSVSARYVSREVIGYQQLDEHGSWETNVEYGPIWVPRTTEVGWAPYRNGNWLWVAPWGWTWVDRAPWGFAPYHYGRWAHIGLRWAWVPGIYLHYERPVYAPALVAFVGGSNGLSVSLNIGSGRGPGVAWFPLAPGEAYRPSYVTSSRYLDNINRRSGNNVTINNTTINNTTVNNNTTIYANQHVHNAVTAVPASTFVKGQFVGGVAQPLTRDQILTSQVGAGAPTITPSTDSMLGTSRRVGNPDNAGNQYRNRPVVATFNPAAVPVPMPRDGGAKYNPDSRRDDSDKEPRFGGRPNSTDIRSRVTSAPINLPATPAVSTVAPAAVLLHNSGRSDIRDRNGRFGERDDGRGNDRGNDAISNVDRRGSNEAVLRHPPENGPATPVMPVIRNTPEPMTNTAPIEQIRRPAIRSDERDNESGNRQFNHSRPLPNNSNANRVEQRRDEALSNGLNVPRENMQPVPNQRPAERVFQAPREVSRPAIQEPTMQQAPRIERQPATQSVNEPRREAPAAVVKPEREKERRDKSDSREKMER